MKKLSLIVLVVSLLCADFVSAQQDPQYTQYMYNMNVVNPAYAGNKEVLSITALYRSNGPDLTALLKTITFFGTFTNK
jgi:hypothetical protein